MRSPPMPTSGDRAQRRRISAATPAACKSPDALAGDEQHLTHRRRPPTPAARRSISRMICSATASASRPSSPLTAHRLLPLHRGDEALELEPQRLPLRRVERQALHELLHRARRGRERGEVHVPPQAIELTAALRQVERQISAALEDADLPKALARHAAGGDVRHRAGREHECARWRCRATASTPGCRRPRAA